MTFTHEEWPHGLRCMDCDHLFAESEQYHKKLVAMSEENPVVELVCIDCALGAS